MALRYDDEQPPSGGRLVFDDEKPSGILDSIRQFGTRLIDTEAEGQAARRQRELAATMERSNAATRDMVLRQTHVLNEAETAQRDAAAQANARYQNSPGAAAVDAAGGAVDLGRDLAVHGAKGVVGLGESAVGIGDLVTGWTGVTPGGLLKDFAGYDPEATRKWLDGFMSDRGQADAKALEKTKGFIDTLQELGGNPRLMAQQIFESLPGTIAAGGVGGVVARRYAGAFLKEAQALGLVGAQAQQFVAKALADNSARITTAVLAAAAGAEGAQSAGSIAETARQAGRDWEDYVLPALGAGVGTAAIGLGAGKVATKLGVGDIETDIALRGTGLSTGRTGPGSLPERLVVEGLKEGVLEEAPQSAQEAGFENVALGRPWDQGLGKATAQGLATGAGMGGGHAALSRAGEPMPENRSGPSTLSASPVTDVTAPVGDNRDNRDNPPTAAEKALLEPRTLTALDRVAEIDRDDERLRDRLAELNNPANGYGQMFDQERQDLMARRLAGQQERDALAKDWPAATEGAPTSFSTEAGVRVQANYALMDADDLVTSHDENLRPNPLYPQELQPRQRERAASELQVSTIVQRLDPARLGLSADAANGAPIVGADGLVESGNARTIALKRVYQANGAKADTYRQFLRENAAQFGITPEQVDGMQRPVLVRVRTTPVNRAEFARQANAATVAQMSPAEQGRSDAARIDSMEDLEPDDNGDFSNAASRPFVRRFMARLPVTEQSGMLDAAGNLSAAGYARVRNAVLAKAYGDSQVLQRMTESLDDNLRNVSRALMLAAPKVAQLREAVAAGRRHDADITPDLMEAVEELSRLKDAGTSVQDALAQAGLLGEQYSPEVRTLLEFLADNLRRPRRMADFIIAYSAALDSLGDPNQGSLLDEAPTPTKGELLNATKKEIDDAASQSTTNAKRGIAGQDAAPGRPAAVQPPAADGSGGSNQGAGPARAKGEVGDKASDDEWRLFGPESGTIGIPRAFMPQIKGDQRGALVNFLQARGIDHERDTVPASSLKPTQAEYSRTKVDRFKGEGLRGERSVLVSSDGHVLDGHHQWLGHSELGDEIPIIRLGAPIRELLEAVNEFPSVRRSEGGATPRDQAKADFRAAAADLADIVADRIGARVLMVPADLPKLHETLVRLFSAAIRVVGTDLRAATRWVKDQLKADPTTKPVWNKITDEAYRRAALEAIEKQDIGDLLGGEPAAARAMIDGRPYDPKTDNFKPPSIDTFLHKAVVDEANASVKTYYTDRPRVDLSAEDRARAEALLAPLLEKAAVDKVVYDQKIIDIARRTNAIGQMLAPIKGLKRAAEKLAIEERFNVAGMKDTLRSTIVVRSYEDVQAVLDEIVREFKLLRDPKNRTGGAALTIDGRLIPAEDPARYGGYADLMVNVVMPSGVIAEIQINVPEMLGAKEGPGHKLYEAYRDAPKDSELGQEILGKMLPYYMAALEAARNSASVIDDQRSGQLSDRTNPSQGDFSSKKKIEPSGNLTNDRSTPSSSVKSMPNVQPSGNLSGTSISRSTPILGQKSVSGYTAKDLFGEQDADGPNAQGGDAGEGAGAVRKPAGQRGAERARSGSGGPSILGDGGLDAAAADTRGLGQARGDGVRSQDEDGGGTEPGDSAGTGAGVPAGRDIPAKSGRNYEFGPDDLTYAGSWLVKAAANVDAVELLKKLEAEGRQATRDEQAVLAKFIGWGASEIANSLFGSKLDKVAKSLEKYTAAIAAMDKAGVDVLRPSESGGWRGHGYRAADDGYWEALGAMRSKFQNFDQRRDITRGDLADVKPEASAARWIALRDRLRAVLSEKELAEASRSTQYAHYTSAAIVRSMWTAMERMGFHGGAILEPGAGIGVFPGLMPQAMAANSSYTGIEYDSITGGILKQLFPDERILVESFVDSKLPKNFYDVAAGNPPFSPSLILADPEYQKQAFALHDYFFAKTIDRVKPGGLVTFVTSRFTMDKLSDKARQYLAERADLVGAIRLPQTAFKRNAGTDVVTDVLFLRKKVPGETFEGAQDWAKSVPITINGRQFPINEYYHAHPEMVLGLHSDEGKMQNSPDPQYTVLPKDGDIDALFAAAAQNLPADIYKGDLGSAGQAAKVREIDFNPKAQKEGNYYVTDAGVLMVREGGVGVRVQGMPVKDMELIKDIVPLRDALKQAQYDQLNDGAWQDSLKVLQAAYKKFTGKHGQINQFTTRMVKVKSVDEDTGEAITDEEPRRTFTLLKKIEDDPDWTLLAALENVNDDTGAITPSAFLSERVLAKPVRASAATPIDAMLTVLNETGAVDIDMIGQRIGLSRADTIEALGTAVYEDPSFGWKTADEYLSGNVKRKLDVARAAARSDKRYERNVTALQAVQPAALEPSKINAVLGMNWIPGPVYEQFLLETAGVQARVEWNRDAKSWIVEEKAGGKTTAATDEWGTARRNVTDLLQSAMTGAPVRIETMDPQAKKPVFDAGATELANERLEKLKDEFQRWIWKDPDRTTALVQRYNDKFNTTVPRSYDGRHLTLPGTSSRWQVFDHVKRGAWRIIQSGNTYLAHAVGSGKAQPLDAKVLTPSGWRLMGDLAPGDTVIAGDGTPTMVEAVFPQGAKEIFRVEFSDGAATECCAEHLWLTQTYLERCAGRRAAKLGTYWPSGHGKVRLLSEIAATLHSPHWSAKNHSIPMVGAVQMNARPLPLDPYVMGLLLGDGCFTANSVMLSSADQEIVAEVRARLPEGCELVHLGRVDYSIVWRGAMRDAVGGGMVSTNPVMNAARTMGLKGLRAHEKFIPADFKWNSIEARVAVLQGLLDADGGVEGNGTSVRLCTTAPRLAADVTEIVQSLGGTVRQRIKQPAYTFEGVRKIGRQAYELCISLPPGVAPFRLPRKANAVVQKSRYAPARYITAVVPVGKKPAQCIRVAHPSHLYVTDDYIVTHNTFQMVISAMEQKRLGLINKPMVVVPNHMLQQFAREWQDLYPAARLMIADENNFHTDNRRRFVSRVALSDLDGVIITQSAFKLLDLDPEFKKRKINEQLEYMRAAYSEAGGDASELTMEQTGTKKNGDPIYKLRGSKDRDPKIKQIERQIERMEQKLLASTSSVGKDRNVRFDELGVDFLYVDEAHNYRKLDFTTARQVKGISPGGSDAALDLYMKSRYLEEKRPGRSLVMASGTPVTNTVAELYTVLRFMNEDELIARDIDDFDSWASMFGRDSTALESNAAGKYEPVTRFAKFANVPELTQMFREFADVLNADHLAALLGDKRPKVKGGSRSIIVTPETQQYQDYRPELEARVEASKKWKPSKDEPNNPDPIIRIIGDGRLAAIDMRFINPRLPPDPESKLNRMIDDVVKTYKSTADLQYNDKAGNVEPNKGAAMMVFSDLGFGEGVAASRGFNARAWFEKRLRDAGVPPAHVAFMSDYKKSADKLKLFKDVNAGRVRILVGSSKNMGTGVNAQQRLHTLFHLDSPWYPADLEQREGRIIRQGNKNPLVEIRAYAANGSYDETMWGMLARKQFFIDQALSGDANLREIDDLDNQSQYAHAAAMVAKDPRVLQLAGLRADIAKMLRLYEGHEQQRDRFRKEHSAAMATIKWNEKHMAEAEKLAGQAVDLSGDRFVAKVGGQSFTSRADWAQDLVKQLRDRSTRVEVGEVKVGEISGFPVIYDGQVFDKRHMAVLRVGVAPPIVLVGDNEMNTVSHVGMAIRATNAIASTAARPARMREEIREARAVVDALTARLEAPFPMAGMLADKLRQADALEAEITAGSPDAAEQVETLWGNMAAEPAVDGDTDQVTRLSRGAGGGMDVKALQAIADRVKAAMPNMPKVHVLKDPADAPQELREYIEEQGAWKDVEGAMHAGELYLFASGLPDALRAEHVLAEHEAAHFGLRAVLGSSLKGVMQLIYNNNANVRRAATALQARGKLTNAQATEEVLVDIPTADLARLRGWRRLVEALRAGLQRMGFENLAAKFGAWLDGTLREQQRADLMAANLVRAARAYVAGKGGVRRHVAAAGTMLSGTLADDVVRQERWLSAEARARGYKDIDELAERDYPLFERLAAMWREKNPADTLLSRTADAYAQAVGQWRQAMSRVPSSSTPLADAGVSIDMPMPTVYQAMGLKSRKLSLPVRYLQGISEKHRDLPANALRDLPQLLSDPMVVIPHVDGGYRALIDAQTAAGEPIVVGVGNDGRVQTVTPMHDEVGHSGRAKFAHMLELELAKSGAKVYARNKEALTEIRASRGIADGYAAKQPLDVSSARAVPAISALHRAPRDKAIVMHRDTVVKKIGEFGPGIRLSRATNPLTAAQRAEAILRAPVATSKPIDAVARTLTRVTGVERMTGAVYRRAAYLVNRYTPEQVKAGLVSDYGVPEAVIDQRALLQGRQRVQLRQAGNLIDKLATLTREESRVAYEWMNMDGADPRAYVSMMHGLPEESVRVLQEVQQMIDRLSREAVRMGQLSEEAFKANRWAYLRRSYAKYTLEQSSEDRAKRARVISILGEQYRGRGLTEAAPMRQIQNTAPEWWKRKLQAGKADAGLKGEKFIRLERRAPTGQGTTPLPGMTGRGAGRIREVTYWPAGETLPAMYRDWDQAGTFAVRDVKGDKLVLWRDFTKDERERMGEIDEARFAIAKTLQGMIHDVEVGRYLEWLAHTQAKKEGETIPGQVVEASDGYGRAFKPGEWVKVPDTKIPGTAVEKYGKLAGRYLPGPVWNDLRQVVNGQFKPFGETYAKILMLWKTSKTALSPAVHMNNVMSNLVMADWHDVTAGHLAKALRILLGAHGRDSAGALGRVGNAAARAGGMADREAAREIMNRYLDSGGDIGSWATQEIARDQLEPLLESLERELAATNGGSGQAQIGVMAALQHAVMLRFPSAWDAFKASKPGKVVGKEASALIDMYQAEDDVFRLAAWLKAKEGGATDLQAGKQARRSFLDYHINAPWVQALRNSALPFVSFTYRAVPMLLETAGTKPHKLLKLMALAGLLDAIGSMIAGGGDDDERKLLPEEKAGRIWGLVPKLIRMPWNDQHGSPVYLDIRRFVPVGDVVDIGQGHSAIPLLPAVTPGGPMVVLGEVILNRSMFTGKNITQDTDTFTQAAGKVVDHLWKAFAPNILGLPGTYATQGVLDSAKGKTDAFGREQSTVQAIASSVGVKLGSYPPDVLMRNARARAAVQIIEIDKNIAALRRQRLTNRITLDQYQDAVRVEQEKKRKVQRELAEKVGG